MKEEILTVEDWIKTHKDFEGKIFTVLWFKESITEKDYLFLESAMNCGYELVNLHYPSGFYAGCIVLKRRTT
jgi:hypothetical protein